jgi:hypothetical protein
MLTLTKYLMKKVALILITALSSICTQAQLAPGFVKEEARDMIAICNSFTFIDLYNSDEDILPAGYKKIYTSGVFGMDNKFQIYEKGHVAIINIRGSTDKKISWLENIYSAMIPAKGVIKIAGENVPYAFAKDPAAAVHSGYALAIAYLSNDIIFHINNMNRGGIHNFIITGHSQGGSLANMLLAYLENLSKGEISKANVFKVYSFAAPMVGNKVFVDEYNRRFCEPKTSINIVNAADPVPTFPLNYKDENYLSDNLQSFLFDRESFSFKKMATDGAVLLFEDKLVGLTQLLGRSASNEISKDLGQVVLPPYVKEINYHKIGNRMELPPVAYPKFLRDSTILKNDSLMAIYKRGSDGQFYNQELYAKESTMWQHKPYNYYVAILKMYFPAQYASLRRKYLPESL